MSHIEINENNFEETTSKGLVLVDFYATWCGPCKMLSAELNKIDTKDFKIGKVNVDEQQGIAMRYRVQSVPTLILFKDGKEIDKKVGFIPADQLIKWVKSH